MSLRKVVMYMMISLQERLKDLRVERGLNLEQLAEKTGLSKSALGSYESDEFKDVSHYALVKLAKFYGVSTDYLLGLTATKNRSNAEIDELHLSDEMIDLLKSGRVNNALLCELATHPDFPRFMAGLEVYVNGMAVKLVQIANAFVDASSANIVRKYNPGADDPYLRQLVAAHIDEDGFCRYTIGRDISEIARSLREIHKDDFASIPVDNPLEVAAEIMNQDEAAISEDSDTALAFICKRLRLNYTKLTDEEKKWLTRIANKSDLLKIPFQRRGKKKTI